MYCLEGAGDTKIAITQEDLRYICRQAEVELHRSEIYQRLIAEVQRELGDAVEGCQHLVKAVGREAIRLALRQLVRQYRVHPSTEPAQSQTVSIDRDSSSISCNLVSDVPVLPAQPTILANQDGVPKSVSPILPNQPNPAEAIVQEQPAVDLPPQPEDPEPKRSRSVARLRKWNKAEAASALEQERDALLRQIGQNFKQVRQAKSMSLDQLHTRTWVPIHQLKALEVGNLDHMPEDIYVRGFIKRIGDALGLDGSEIAASIPIPDKAKTVIPSWHQSVGGNRSIKPIHFCIGYTVLMAGAVGGLSWMSHPLTPDAINLNAPESSPAATQSVQQADISNTTVNSSPTDMAQPEVMPPETLPF